MRSSSGSSLRVGFLAAELSGENGWARLALETIRHLGNMGVRGRVLVDGRGRAPAGAAFESLPTLPAWPQSRPEWALAAGRALPRVTRGLRGCDLAHCLVEPYVPLASLATAWLGIPLVVTAVGTYSARSLDRWRRFAPFAFWTRRAAAIACISRYTEQRVREWRPNAPTLVINPGVDPSHFSPGTPRGRPAGIVGRVVLGVGAVKPRKGYDVVVRAIGELGPGFEDVQLCIAGDCQTHAMYAERLMGLADELGISSRIHLLGQVAEAELIDWYRRADVFVLNASNREEHFEGFGLALLEANACGTPIIGCEGCGSEDIVQDGDNGLLIPQENPEATSSAIRKVLGDPELARRLGQRGIARARAMSWQGSARKMLELYNRILDHS